MINPQFSGQQINLDMTVMKTASAFCNKIWQAARFLVLAHERSTSAVKHDLSCDLSPENQWILSRCSKTVREVNMHFENKEFHLVTRALRSFLYGNVCDVYLVSDNAYENFARYLYSKVFSGNRETDSE